MGARLWSKSASAHGPGSEAGPERRQVGTKSEYQLVATDYDGERRETYAYDAGGVLLSVHLAETGYVDNGDGTISSTGTLGTAVLVGAFTNHLLGRTTTRRGSADRFVHLLASLSNSRWSPSAIRMRRYPAVTQEAAAQRQPRLHLEPLLYSVKTEPGSISTDTAAVILSTFARLTTRPLPCFSAATYISNIP